MKKFLSVFMAFSLACALFFSSCSEEEGSVSGGEWTVAEYNVTLVIDGETKKEYSGKEISFAQYAQTYGKKGYKIAWTDAERNAITEEKMAANEKTKYTFYGTSVPISYTVHFDSTGCEGTAPADISCTYDAEFDMPKNELSAEGKFADGWYMTDSTGSRKLYKGGTKHKNLCTEDGAVVTFYPYLIPESELCTITFKSEYGTAPEAVKVKSGTYVAKEGYIYALPGEEYYYLPDNISVSGKGYTSALNSSGWRYETDSGSKTVDSYTSVEVTKDMTFTAVWNTPLYKVEIESGVGTVREPKFYASLNTKFYSSKYTGSVYSDGYKLPEIPDADGFILTGWTYKKAGDSSSTSLSSTSPVTITSDITFTAVWARGGDAKLTVTLPSASSGDIALTNSNGTLTASLSGASTFKWYINGTEVSGATGASFNIYGYYGSLSGGVNSIMAVATVSGKTYSATAMVKKAN